MGRIRIIAEAGVNHNGSLEMAKRMVDAAADAGADYIKFQTFKAENLVTADAQKAEYQKKNTGDYQESQLEMLKKLELSEEDHYELKAYCESKGIGFMSSAFDIEGIRFLRKLGQKIWKVPSGEITNYPYLCEIIKCEGEILISTGMCSREDVDDVLKLFLMKRPNFSDVTLLHCNTQYPTPMQDVNLKAMQHLHLFSYFPYGYSDHTRGIEIPIAAAALGASVIEKHFTLSRDLPGPDHQASLEPDELKAMVLAIRNVERALGDGIKRVTPSESANRAIARKSIVAARPIARGELLTEENITTKRPGTGLSPMQWPSVIGTRAVRGFEKDEQIEI